MSNFESMSNSINSEPPRSGSGGASLNDQVAWCTTTKNILNHLQENLLKVHTLYLQLVQDLISNGLEKDVTNSFVNLCNAYLNETKRTNQYIEDVPIAYIKKRINELAQIMENLNKIQQRTANITNP